MLKFILLFAFMLAGLWLSALAFNHVNAYIGFVLVIIDICLFSYYLFKFITFEIKKQNEKFNL